MDWLIEVNYIYTWKTKQVIKERNLFFFSFINIFITYQCMRQESPRKPKRLMKRNGKEENSQNVNMVNEWLKENGKYEAYAGIIFGQKFQIRDDFDDVQRRWLLALAERKKVSVLPSIIFESKPDSECLRFLWKIALQIIWQGDYDHLVNLVP